MPFTQEEFLEVFAVYNVAMWPLPVLSYVLGIMAVGLTFWRSRGATATILVALALMWLVNGVAYHWSFFARINPIARLFGLLFVLQAFLLAGASLLYPSFRVTAQRDARTIAGLGLAVFAMVFYPVVGRIAGHVFPAVPIFGLAPCPTTIFTIGLLLMGTLQWARWLLVVPAIWAMIGGSAAILLNVPQDYGLIVALLALIGFAIAAAVGAGFDRHEPKDP